jgi:hypothetical protein
MIQVIECEQGGGEWLAARAGIPTASMFHTVLAKGVAGGESKTRREYMLKLAGERLTGQPMANYSNGHMERGRLLEEEARRFYTFLTDLEPKQVGFIRNGEKGCSPDSLIGDDGMLEIKTALPHILISYLLSGSDLPAHKAQTQGGLWIAEREWIDTMVYWPGLPPFRHRATRDDIYIAKLSSAVDAFNDELAAIVEKIHAYADGVDDKQILMDALTQSQEAER